MFMTETTQTVQKFAQDRLQYLASVLGCCWVKMDFAPLKMEESDIFLMTNDLGEVSYFTKQDFPEKQGGFPY